MVGHNLHPVTVGIEDERQTLHATLVWPLLEWHAKFLKTFARRLDVVHSDRDVAEPTARLGVARSVAGEIRVRLGPMVVRELEDTYVEWAEAYATKMIEDVPSRDQRLAAFSSAVRFGSEYPRK
jgi:hypothetical protein